MSEQVDKAADEIFEAIDRASHNLTMNEWRGLLYRVTAGCNERIGESHELES